MLAFTPPAEVSKEDLLASLRNHRERDEIIKGTYWLPSRKMGCAVGCSVMDFLPPDVVDPMLREYRMSEVHRWYPDLFGLPSDLARIEDGIFEALPTKVFRNELDHPLARDLRGGHPGRVRPDGRARSVAAVADDR